MTITPTWSQRLLRPVLLLTSVCGLGLAVIIAQQELALPFEVMTDELRLQDPASLASFEEPAGNSIRKSTDKLVMDFTACQAATESGPCAELLRQALNRKPTDGRLWLAYAEALANEGDADISAIDALRQSYIFAPRENWMTESRTSFALAVWSGLPDELKATARAEIAGKLDDWDFLTFLGEKYAESPFAHAAIEEALADATPQQKLKFLNRVKAATGLTKQ